MTSKGLPFIALSAYRRSMAVARRRIAPGPEADAHVSWLRTTFRDEAQRRDVQRLVEQAESRASYLLATAPRRPGGPTELADSNGFSVYHVAKDGHVVHGRAERKGSKASRASDDGIDPADLARHQQLLNRQHFGNHASVPRGPVY